MEGLGRRRVTVIDDSPELLALFGDLLRYEGVEIALFEQSVTLREIEESAPDLLVIDLRLGRESLAGMEIIRLVRAHRELRSVPIIVCSAALDAIAEHEAALRGTPNTFILPKPFSLEELEACVTDALGEQFEAATG
jgi:two-component system chemotaxis response regulator CheY